MTVRKIDKSEYYKDNDDYDIARWGLSEEVILSKKDDKIEIEVEPSKIGETGWRAFLEQLELRNHATKIKLVVEDVYVLEADDR